MLKGIDVSVHQGKINWEKVKNHVDFAILRCGYGNNVDYQDDREFFENVNGCIKNNIPFGIYLYSYAMSESEIESEIKHTLRLLQNIKPTLPVYIDVEERRQQNLGSKITDYVIRFCEEIKKNGFKPGVYANKWWMTSILDYERIKDYSIWIAQYNTECTFNGNYDIWQYTSSGAIEGINGNVDMNYLYNKSLLNITTPKKEEPKKEESKNENIIKYKVVKNDNLTKIAKMFNTTVEKLVKDNNIENPDLIFVDQELIIKSNDEIKYKVVKNDNLTKIAKMFNTTVEKIASDNNIVDPNLIITGQELIIK